MPTIGKSGPALVALGSPHPGPSALHPPTGTGMSPGTVLPGVETTAGPTEESKIRGVPRTKTLLKTLSKGSFNWRSLE